MFTETVLNELYKIGKVVTIKSKTELIAVGDKVDKTFVVLRGAFISLYYDPVEETFHTDNFHLSTFNNVMTVIDSYILGSPSNREIRAVSNSEVLVLKKGDLEKLIAKNAEVRDVANENTMNTLIFENNIKAKRLSYSPADFYKHLITNYSQITKNVPSKYIADFMGVSPQYLSKIKRKM